MEFTVKYTRNYVNKWLNLYALEHVIELGMKILPPRNIPSTTIARKP